MKKENSKMENVLEDRRQDWGFLEVIEELEAIIAPQFDAGFLE